MSRREFWKLLAEFLGRGLTILMATPYLDEAERCTRVALLHDGRLLALDRPSTLQDMLRGQLLEVITATPRPPVDALARVKGVADVQSFGDSAHVRLAGVEPGRRRGCADRGASCRGHHGDERAPDRPVARGRVHRADQSEVRGSRVEAGSGQFPGLVRASVLDPRSSWLETPMKRILPIIIVLIVGGGWPALAQTTTPTAPPVAVTLDEAIAQGLANSRRLAEIEARVDAAGFVVQQRATGDHPDVALVGGYTRTNHVDVFSITFPLRPSQVVYPGHPRQLSAPASTFSGRSTPPAASMRSSAPRQAEQNAVGEELETRAERSAPGNHAGVLGAGHRARGRSGALAIARRHQWPGAGISAAASAPGLIPPNDVSSAEAQASRQQLLSIEAANARGIAEADLAPA